MKRKLIFCIIMMTTLLLSSCGRNNTPQNSPAPEMSGVNTDTSQSIAPSVTGNDQSLSTDNANLSEEDAKQIALAKVPGATAQDIRDFHTDYDNSKLKYEGEIYYENIEYDFEIDANTGEILEWDVEPVDKKPGT